MRRKMLSGMRITDEGALVTYLYSYAFKNLGPSRCFHYLGKDRSTQIVQQ